jgi:23S rRNA (pseudouridine1915-N3)-methyltransferase
VKFILLAVGKQKPRSLRELTDDYLGRIRRMTRIEEREVQDDRALAKSIPEGAHLVLMQVGGRELSSDALSRQIEAWASTGKGDICFVIGGAEGLPEEVTKRGHFELSLSRFTLPHRLARLILLEQIYRALTILRGEPYARED